MPTTKLKRSWTLEVGTPKRHEGDSAFVRSVAQILKDSGGTTIRRNSLLLSLRGGVISCIVRLVDQHQQVIIEGFFVRLQVRGKFDARLLVTPTDVKLPAPAVDAIHKHCGDRINEFLREKSGRSFRELAKVR